MYANDIPCNLKSKVALYADDTILYSSVKNDQQALVKLQEDLNSLESWCLRNKLTINTDKTKYMIFGTSNARSKITDSTLNFGGKPLELVTSYNYLGVKIDPSLNYELHAKAIIQRVSDKIALLRRIRRFINSSAALNIYKNMILPILEYGDLLLVSARSSTRRKLQTLQNKALKCALGLDPLTSTDEVHRLARMDKLHLRRKQHIIQLMFCQQSNPFLWDRRIRRRSGISTRSSYKKQFVLKKSRTEKLRNSVTSRAPYLWNELPADLQNTANLKLFKIKLYKHLIKKAIKPNTQAGVET